MPDLTRRRDEAFALYSQLSAQVNASIAYINAFSPGDPNPTQGRTLTVIPILPPLANGSASEKPVSVPSESKTRQRAPRKLVYQHVDQIMKEGEFRLGQLRDELMHRFKIMYGSSSIHRALTAGRVAGRYVVKDGIWSIKGGAG